MFKVKMIGEIELLEPVREGVHFWDKYTQKSIDKSETFNYDLEGLSKEYSFFYHLPIVIKIGVDPVEIFKESHLPSSEKDILVKIELDRNYYEPLKEEKIGKNGHFIFGCVHKYAKWLFQYLEIICVKEKQLSELNIPKMYRVIHLEQQIVQRNDKGETKSFPIHNFTLFNEKYVSYWEMHPGDEVFKFKIVENVYDMPENRVYNSISTQANSYK